VLVVVVKAAVIAEASATPNSAPVVVTVRAVAPVNIIFTFAVETSRISFPAVPEEFTVNVSKLAFGVKSQL
jgi:hypothetical protein